MGIFAQYKHDATTTHASGAILGAEDVSHMSNRDDKRTERGVERERAQRQRQKRQLWSSYRSSVDNTSVKTRAPGLIRRRRVAEFER